MKIYKIIPNFEKFKYYIFVNEIKERDRNENLRNGFFYGNFNGEIPNIELSIFVGKTKKEKSRSSDFTASAFSSSLFVSQEVKEILDKNINNIEFYETKTNDNRVFYYLNPIIVIDMLDYNTPNELNKMLITNTYKFKESVLFKSAEIIRDKNLSGMFVTESFKSKFEMLLSGVNFEYIHNFK